MHNRTIGLPFQPDPRLECLPAVVDANVLINDVCANLRRPEETALLGLATAGRLRLLVTDRVAHEVTTRMKRVAKSDTTRALALWESHYRPLIRVVEVDGHEAEDALSPWLENVRQRDRDDLPTAHLALLCAPCLVLTKDRDLLDHGFGAPEWLTGVLASGELGDLDRMLHDGAKGSVTMLGLAAMGGFHGVRRAAMSPVIVGLALAAGWLLLTDGRSLAAERVASYARRAEPTADALGEGVQRMEEQRRDVIERLGPYVLQPVVDPPLCSRLGSRLAREPEPVPVTALAAVEGITAEEARTVLRAHPAFAVRRGVGWQLGEP